MDELKSHLSRTDRCVAWGRQKESVTRWGGGPLFSESWQKEDASCEVAYTVSQGSP